MRRAGAAPGGAAGVRRGELWVLTQRRATPVTYTPAEMMAAVAARELRDGEVVFVGIGLPNLACNLARATHAPNLVLIYESGAVGAVPERLPVSIGDPSLVTGSLMVCGMADVFQSPAAERPDRGRVPRRRADRSLRQHQHDRRGQLRRARRCGCPGSGGAAEIAIHARRTVVISRLSRRAFPETGGLRHQPRPPHARAHAARARDAGRGPGQGRDRQGHPRGRPGDWGAGAGRALSGRHRGRGARRRRLAAPVSRAASATVEPPTEPRSFDLLRDVLDPHRLYLKG